MIKKLFLHPLFYFISCIIWALQTVVFLAVWDGAFTGVGYDIPKMLYLNFMVASSAMVILGFPLYLLLAAIFTKAKLQHQKYYIFGAMFVAFCVTCAILSYLRFAQYWSVDIFSLPCLVSMLMGILPGMIYYALKKKFLS